MDGFIEIMRSGAWLTRQRLRLWAVASLIASLAGLIYILATAHGLSDYQGRPIGTDFSNVYAAGTYVLERHPEAPFDAPTQHVRERQIFGEATPFYGWHYPPFFLFIAAALALLPYLPALAAWQGTTLVLYLLAMRSILFSPSPLRGGSRAGRAQARGGGGDENPPFPAATPPTSPARGEMKSSNHLWLLLAVAFPAVFVNLGHGHNGFLTAALIGAGLLLLDARPIVAGILFGLLAYKPQFGLLIPLVLVATDRWKTFAAAAATVGVLALAATLAFGPEVWPAFFASTTFTREAVLEAGGTGWHKIQTVFSWVRMWGGSVPLAYAVQMLVTLTLAVALVWLWRSRTSARSKAAGLIIASLLATPYSLDYDLMALAPAIAFWAGDGLSRGFRPWEKTLLAALWIVPLIARNVAAATLIPLTAPLLFAAFALLLHRAAAESGAPLLWFFPHRAVR
jgi:Glycosyltransferase family 87